MVCRDAMRTVPYFTSDPTVRSAERVNSGGVDYIRMTIDVPTSAALLLAKWASIGRTLSAAEGNLDTTSDEGKEAEGELLAIHRPLEYVHQAIQQAIWPLLRSNPELAHAAQRILNIAGK